MLGEAKGFDAGLQCEGAPEESSRAAHPAVGPTRIFVLNWRRTVLYKACSRTFMRVLNPLVQSCCRDNMNIYKGGAVDPLKFCMAFTTRWKCISALPSSGRKRSILRLSSLSESYASAVSGSPSLGSNAAPPPLDEQSQAPVQPLRLGLAAATTAGWQKGCRSRHSGIEAAALHARPGTWSPPAAPQWGAPHLE